MFAGFRADPATGDTDVTDVFAEAEASFTHTSVRVARVFAHVVDLFAVSAAIDDWIRRVVRNRLTFRSFMRRGLWTSHFYKWVGFCRFEVEAWVALCLLLLRICLSRRDTVG